MIKWTAAIGLSAVLLSGCSLLDEANNTLTYATDITEFLNETQQFATEVPAILEDAAANPGAVQEIQSQLENMQQNIESVQEMEVPVIAESIHSQLLGYSNELEASVDHALNQLETGVLDPAVLLENTELLKTIQELQELRVNVEKLGQ